MGLGAAMQVRQVLMRCIRACECMCDVLPGMCISHTQ